MQLRIGRGRRSFRNKTKLSECSSRVKREVPRKSIVEVKFPGHHCALSYYNDRFDLQVGDYVYVDGKLEGHCGRVTSISYAFKIKLSDYKRVIALVDTRVKGQFCYAGAHLITFDRSVIPRNKISTWFKAPAKDSDEFSSGQDDVRFPLTDIKKLDVSPEIADRGYDYYLEGTVQYLCIDNGQGYAIVTGGKPYEIEFVFHDGEISKLTCSCFCCYHCKHEVAVMLQLKEALVKIEKHYAAQYEQAGYFAVISKETLFAFAVDGQACGSLTLN